MRGTGGVDKSLKPMKKSFAGTILSPSIPSKTKLASNANANEGSSAAGSAYTILPPWVPLFLIAGCATCLKIFGK